MVRPSMAEKRVLVRVGAMCRSVGYDLMTHKEDQALGRKLEAKGLMTLTPTAGTYLEAKLTEEGEDKEARVRGQVNKVERAERLAQERARREEAKTQRPCLVNILTGERYYGAPGESEDELFGRLANS